MMDVKKDSKTKFNESLLPKKNILGDDVIKKKVVKISEESPTIVEPSSVRKTRPKSADIRPRSRSASGQRPFSAQVSGYSALTDQRRTQSRRPLSAQLSHVRDENKERKDLIASFNRSLRLLGLHVEELPTSNRNHRKPVRVEGPTFSTRLQSRTVSLDNIRASALLGPRFGDRRTVAHAVYQEWYFTKLQQEKEKRLRESLQQELEQAKKEQRKQELRSRAEENFLLWKIRKDQEALELKKIQKEREEEMEKLRSDSAKIQKALAEWNNNKTQKLKKESREKKEREAKEAEKKMKDEQEKQQHAREAYACWQKKATEEQKKRAEKEQKAKELAERQRDKMQQRHKEAQECFVAWKQGKDKQIKCKIKQARLQTAQSSTDRGRRLAERMYEAEQAYQDWLDSLDVRSGHSRSNSVSPLQVRQWS